MKKYIKNNNLIPLDNKIKIYDDISCVPINLPNEIVLVKNDGIYEVNGSSVINIYSSSKSGSNVIGEIKMFYGNTIPNNWLELDGSQYDISLYPDLYTFLGTNVLPDYRECVFRGSSTSQSSGVFSDDAMLSHTHTSSGGSHKHTFTVSHKHTRSQPYNNCSGYWCTCSCVANCCIEIMSSNTTWCPSTTTPLGNTGSPSVSGGTSGITIIGTNTDTVTRDKEFGVTYIICAKE